MPWEQIYKHIQVNGILKLLLHKLFYELKICSPIPETAHTRSTVLEKDPGPKAQQLHKLLTIGPVVHTSKMPIHMNYALIQEMQIYRPIFCQINFSPCFFIRLQNNCNQIQINVACLNVTTCPQCSPNQSAKILPMPKSTEYNIPSSGP